MSILGATGSIGVSTLDVLSRHQDAFDVFALTGHTRLDVLAKQCVVHQPKYAVVASDADAEKLQQFLGDKCPQLSILCGVDGLCQVAAAPEVDTVMAAIVGAAGLAPTLSAVRAAKKVLLANKESLVMAGSLFMDAVAASGAILLPIDSEHNAIFQCMPQSPTGDVANHKAIKKVLLTASGGPFRSTPLAELQAVTPDEACAHPNWAMGRKISVDSATMMNKGLELIEACWLFSLDPSAVDIVVHPQSIVHSMVEYVDGSVLAQLGNPDMRTPIAHALAWPDRMISGVSSLDLLAAARLDFEAPDMVRFPCLKLAVQAAQQKGNSPTVLNAANEVAVAAFLDNKLPFLSIATVVESVLNAVPSEELDSLSAVQACDERARQEAMQVVSTISQQSPTQVSR